MRVQSYALPVNQEQTHIFFSGAWREILHDQEGAFYFLYESRAVYVSISYYPPYRGKIQTQTHDWSTCQNMTEQQTNDNNKLIAEFMGIAWKEEQKCFDGINATEYYRQFLHPGKFWFPPYEIMFHASWDWLMPVIEKIKSLSEEPEELDGLRDVLWWGRITDVYKEVIDCILAISGSTTPTDNLLTTLHHLELQSDIARPEYLQECKFKVCGMIQAEPETWAIDAFNSDDDLVNTYLYESKTEYFSDLNTLSTAGFTIIS